MGLTSFDICQNESINFLASRYHAACADAPGLGKTLTAIRAAQRIGARKVLVICPASVRTNWHEHLQDEFGLLHGWDVISYNSAVSHYDAGLHAAYDVCIIDEAHFCKEPESKRAQAVLGKGGLASRAKYIWALSGTFAPNYRPVEYYPLLKTLHPDFASMSYAKYTQRYCGAYFNGREMDVRGATNTDEFKGLLSKFMITHTKAQAFPGRKAPIVSRVGVTLSDKDVSTVRQAESKLLTREALLSPSREHYSQMGDMATLRRLIGIAMVPSVVDFVEEKLEGVEKIVVFFQHTEVGRQLNKALNSFSPVLYEGGMNDAQKEEAKVRFRGDKTRRVFLGQQQAAGTGINGLQHSCSMAVFAEPDWVPGDTEQRIDRLDRMGQDGELVTAYILFAYSTISATILNVHDRKDRVGVKL